MFFVGPCSNVNFLLSARATEVWSGGTGVTCVSLSTDALGRGVEPSKGSGCSGAGSESSCPDSCMALKVMLLDPMTF